MNCSVIDALTDPKGGQAMHVEAYEYTRRAIAAYPAVAQGAIVEIGARNINGSVRELFAGAAEYLATDLQSGRGVDMVVDATDAHALGASVCDTVVCCEVLEHAPVAPIIASAARWLRPGGYFLATCATTGRAPHSAVDGGALRPGEHYENVTAEAMIAALDAAGLTAITVETNTRTADLYVLAQKPAADESQAVQA